MTRLLKGVKMSSLGNKGKKIKNKKKLCYAYIKGS